MKKRICIILAVVLITLAFLLIKNPSQNQSYHEVNSNVGTKIAKIQLKYNALHLAQLPLLMRVIHRNRVVDYYLVNFSEKWD